MNLETFEQLIEAVEEWGIERGLMKQENYQAQFMKFVEEAGELASALNHHFNKRQCEDYVNDAFGDVLVTLIILAKQTDFDLKTALRNAYEEISGRSGQTVNGVFIKSEILTKP